MTAMLSPRLGFFFSIVLCIAMGWGKNASANVFLFVLLLILVLRLRNSPSLFRMAQVLFPWR